jgi:hypothetical protein
MATIPLSQIITEIRQTANVQHTDFLSDVDEMPRIANQAISNAYDTVVECYAPYFAAHAPFSLTSSNAIELDQIVNPTQSPQAQDSTTVGVIASGTYAPTLTEPFAPPTNYTATFSVKPSTSNTDSSDVVFTVYVNGVSTGCSVTVTSGDTAEVINTTVFPEFYSTDAVSVKTNAYVSHTLWTAHLNFILTPVFHNRPFYKELGLDWLGQSRPISVPRLESFMARNQGNGLSDGLVSGLGRSYDLIGSQLQMFPPNGPFAGNYMLHYMPSAPVLDDVTDLPTEMERFRTMFLLEGAIMVKLKRNMEVTDLERRLAIKKKETETALRHRIKEPKAIPMRIIGNGGRWGNNGWGW